MADIDPASDPAGHRSRLRARLLEGGGEAFLDYELLEYILGLAIPRRDTKPLAKRLLAEFGSFPALLAARPAELARVEGLSDGGTAALKFVEAASLRSLKAAAIDRRCSAAGRRCSTICTLRWRTASPRSSG